MADLLPGNARSLNPGTVTRWRPSCRKPSSECRTGEGDGRAAGTDRRLSEATLKPEGRAHSSTVVDSTRCEKVLRAVRQEFRDLVRAIFFLRPLMDHSLDHGGFQVFPKIFSATRIHAHRAKTPAFFHFGNGGGW